MANDPNRDLLPVKDVDERSTRGLLGRPDHNIVSKLKRCDLEDRYMRLYEENTQIKKQLNCQEEKVKRLGTKLLRLINEKKNSAECVGKKQDKGLDELHMRIIELEHENYTLKDRNIVLKQQLANHARQHVAAHRSPNRSVHTTPRISQRQCSAPNVNDCNYILSNRNAPPDTQLREAEEHIRGLNQEIKSLHNKIDTLQSDLEKSSLENQKTKVCENIELIRLQRSLKQQSIQIASLQAQIQNSEKSQKLLRDELVNAHKENEEALQLISVKQKEILDLYTKLEEKNLSRLEHEEMRERINDLTAERNALKERAEFLLKTIECKCNESDLVRELKNLLASERAKNEQLKSSLGSPHKSLGPLKQKVSIGIGLPAVSKDGIVESSDVPGDLRNVQIYDSPENVFETASILADKVPQAFLLDSDHFIHSHSFYDIEDPLKKIDPLQKSLGSVQNLYVPTGRIHLAETSTEGKKSVAAHQASPREIPESKGSPSFARKIQIAPDSVQEIPKVNPKAVKSSSEKEVTGEAAKKILIAPNEKEMFPEGVAIERNKTSEPVGVVPDTSKSSAKPPDVHIDSTLADGSNLSQPKGVLPKETFQEKAIPLVPSSLSKEHNPKVSILDSRNRTVRGSEILSNGSLKTLVSDAVSRIAKLDILPSTQIVLPEGKYPPGIVSVSVSPSTSESVPSVAANEEEVKQFPQNIQPDPCEEVKKAAAAEKMNLMREMEFLKQLLKSQTELCNKQEAEISRLKSELQMHDDKYQDTVQRLDTHLKILRQMEDRVNKSKMTVPDETSDFESTYTKVLNSFAESSDGVEDKSREESKYRREFVDDSYVTNDRRMSKFKPSSELRTKRDARSDYESKIRFLDRKFIESSDENDEPSDYDSEEGKPNRDHLKRVEANAFKAPSPGHKKKNLNDSASEELVLKPLHFQSPQKSEYQPQKDDSALPVVELSHKKESLEEKLIELKESDQKKIWKQKQPHVSITVEWLKLESGTSVWNNDAIKLLFVDFSFLDVKGEETETPNSLKKPKKSTEKCHFNFTKGVSLTEYRKEALEAAWAKPEDDLITFKVVSEPEDNGEDTDCIDIGVASITGKQFLESNPKVSLLLQVKNTQNPDELIGILSVRLNAVTHQ